MRSLHLLYHELRPAGSRYTYVTPCEEFEAHCGLYARLQAAVDVARLRPEITFDDGHRSDLLFALPLLQRFDLRATFFITAGWTGRRAGYMNWEELRQLRAAGQRVGAHGMHHKLLTGCSRGELVEELRGARLRLEDGLGGEVRTMSLPGGRANGRVLRACEEAGYLHVFTSAPQVTAMDDAPRTVGRLNLRGGTTVAWLERVLDPASGALRTLETVDQLKRTAQRVLGDRLYARVWALRSRQEPGMAGAEEVAS